MGGNTYSGLTSTGPINIQTSSGNLTISQNVSTTSTSALAASPALLLAAGTSSAIGSDTYNIILSGTPTFTIGTGGIADFYSGSITNSTGLNSYILARSANSITGGAGISTQPSSAGYNAIYRLSANIYLDVVESQTGTYGTASSLQYWYSTSPTSYGAGYVPTALSGISALNGVQTFTAGATSVSVNSGGLTGTIAISTALTQSLAANTYSLSLTPSLTLAGYTFFSGNAPNFTVNPVSLNLAISKPYDGSGTFTNANTYTLTGMVLSQPAPTITSGSATVSNVNVGTSTAFTANTFALSNSNYTLTGGTVSAGITQQSSVTYTGSSGGAWSSGANWTVTSTIGTTNITGAVPTFANVATVVIPSGKTVSYDNTILSSAPTSSVGVTANGTLSFANTTATTFTPAISGSGSVAVTGSGQVTLSGSNSYQGTTNINSGSTLQLGNANATGASAVTVNGTLDLNGYSANLASLAGASGGVVTSTVSGNTVLTVGSGNTSTTYSGVIQNGSGTVALVQNGIGSLTLANSNTYSGGTTVSAGTLIAADAGAFGTGVLTNNATVNVAAGITSLNLSGLAGTTSGAVLSLSNLSGTPAAVALTLNGSVNSSYAGSITGLGSLTQSGSNAVTLSGANTFSGGTSVNSGSIVIGVNSVNSSGTLVSGALGTGSATVASGAAINLNGKSLGNALTISGTGISSSGALYNSSVSSASVNGAITLAADTLISNAGAVTFNGAINGAFNLTASTNSTGGLTFAGAVGGVTPLSSFTTTATGGTPTCLLYTSDAADE